MATKIVALVGLSVVTLGANAKPYGGDNGGYYGKYGGGKYGGVSDSYDDGYYKGSKYGGVSDSYDDGYKGSKYGGYGYNAPKPKVSWWKPWSWKYAKKSYSYGDEYEYGYDNGLTKADLREAAHAYVGLSETLKLDEFRALPMPPNTTTTEAAIPTQAPNQFECTCGCNVGHQAFACISFLFDKDGNEIPPPEFGELSALQNVYQPVENNKFIGTSQTILTNTSPSNITVKSTTRLQGNSMPHYAGGMRINTITATSVQFTDPNAPMDFQRAPLTQVQKQSKVFCDGPQAVIDECELRCNKAVEDKLLERNEFEQKCWVIAFSVGSERTGKREFP
ncbi:hypothetical protein PPROV_000793900 [Pycnococcus provasolii]|uniref:Apple domain-containing protein n=1 Tax=Pycnococcus provasolii TaxID=41880 RepID=A0A830HQC9_9CHLO|nr:hypothetical protein PPROV_000793900 [Pycnococcus provasolii]